MPALVDLTGKTFGRLTVIERDTEHKGKDTFWLCKCACGNIVSVRAPNLKCGKTKSCGCIQKEIASKTRATHRASNTRLYRIWANMKTRCNNNIHKEYENYGGRGICMCSEWNGFETFRDWAMSNGYADNLSIDRIDNNGDYCPENCRWATAKEQANNTTNNRWLECNGVRHTLSEWSCISGVPVSTLRNRLKRGWAMEDAIKKQK